MRFAGIDIPAAGGSLLPALAPVADYLRRTDPEALPVLRTAMGIAESFAGGSGAVAAPAWARLTTADQDALTAALTRLLIRFRSLEPLYVSRGDQHGYDIALRRLEGACHADHTFRAMADLFAGRGLTADTSARDVYMAGSVLWHLERFEPVTLHRPRPCPVWWGGRVACSSAGLRPSREDQAGAGTASAAVVEPAVAGRPGGCVHENGQQMSDPQGLPRD
ncbi:erythromycin esterase family protein [Streptomyces sp. NPDC052701]|uniref:erythromycin esterase family protein n=1 Tax=Streptomyces sp. NPDC052701 TaxID=3155533 RepID=UPI003434458E